MADKTAISWTHRPGTVGRTWNPGQGCSRVSEGCRNCYAERIAARFAESGWSQGLINLKTRKWNGTVRLAPHRLAEPFSWHKPSTVFTNSMTDLFHEGYSDTEIAAVFGVMAACPQHTFQVLTKRSARMLDWFQWISGGHDTPENLCAQHADLALTEVGHQIGGPARSAVMRGDATWPLPNVWLGVSVENQGAADERIPHLLRTSAAIRFLSCEPLLGPLDLTSVAPSSVYHCDALAGETRYPIVTTCKRIDQVIAGCESGPGARPCDVEWLRSLRNQCRAAGVAYFLKQAVELVVQGHALYPSKLAARAPDRTIVGAGEGSKRKGGGVIELPYLDGVQHAEFPEVSRG